MNHPLAVYLPVDRRHVLAAGTELPEHSLGTALFADISGFTPLMEALVRALGARRGAEELPRQLNLVYDALIREVDTFGGSVIDFAGDAITCWFDGDAGLRATTCALAMQATMRDFAQIELPSGGTASLAMKIGIASGPVRRFVVGDPGVQLIDTLAGSTLTRMAAAEQVTAKGEVVLEEGTARALGACLEVQAWRNDESGARFAVVAGLHQSAAPLPWPLLPPESLSPEQLRSWLLPTVYERLRAGQGEFLTELRPAMALFLRFGGIDYDSDPEAGQKLDGYIRWVQGLLVQYEGVLLSISIGDKGSYLYIAFGVPIAHEDDARRAALTALALRTPPAELSYITEVQIGLTHGTMRTGAYGGSTRRTYGSLGDDVNLAARLMQYAQPGQIIASVRVQALTSSLFAWQRLAEIRVKGKADPISIFALWDKNPKRERIIHLTEATYTLPMIGRTAEVALLEEKMALARQGRGQVVGITGEAGMGKSRLVAKVIRRAQAQGFSGYGGECESYGMDTPYLVWHPIWRAFFDLPAGDAPEVLEELAQQVAALDPSLLPRLPLLGPVLGLSIPDNELTHAFDPQLRQRARQALLIDALKARAQQGAVLLILEDCHWLDAASHDLLEAIGHAIWNQPVLLLLAYRPPELEQSGAPRVSTLAHFTLLSLTELGEQEAEELIAGRMAQLWPGMAGSLPPTLLSQLVARAQGNPFYLEELTNYLHDQALDPQSIQALEQVDLPTSLHRLILSRIDRLTEPQKALLKVASIIGRLFRLRWLLGYYPALGDVEIVRRDLEALSRLDLTPLERPEPELIYLFKHIITREVTYESLPYATRAQLHKQLAMFLEREEAGTVEGYLDLLAYHYTHSNNLPKKRESLRRAGEAAQSAYAHGAAQAYYERLLPLLQETSEQWAIHLRLGTVLEWVGQWERAEEQYQAAVALADTLPPGEVQARSAQALGKLYRNQGQYEKAQHWLGQALAQWEALDAQEGVSQTLTELGVLTWRQGNATQAVPYLERSQAICRARSDPKGLAYTLNNLGLVALSQGSYEVAQARLEESLALRREIGDQWGIAMALNDLGIVAIGQENDEMAQNRLAEGLALRREIGDKQGIAYGLNNLGYLALCQGNLAEARALLDECLTLGREMGDQWAIAGTLNNLGMVAYRQEDMAAAARYYQESLLLTHAIGEKAQRLYALVGLAALAGRKNDLGHHRQVACLVGTIEALCREIGLKLELMEQRLFDETQANLRARLGDDAFVAAQSEGQALSLDDALALALAVNALG